MVCRPTQAAAGCLRTTAKKVLVAHFASDFAPPLLRSTPFVVIHAKEPKEARSARVLARFAAAVGEVAAQQLGTQGAAPPLVAMLDTNLAEASLATAFAEELSLGSLDALPTPPVRAS